MSARPVSRIDLEERWHDFSRTSYLTVFGVMKGAVSATAAVVFFQIMTTPAPLAPQAENVVLWIAAFIGMIMTYQANSLGTIMMFWTPTWRDIVPSFLVGILEFSLFASLTPQALRVQHREQLGLWFAIFGFYALVGGSLAGHASFKVRKLSYDSRTTGIMKDYAQSQRYSYYFAVFSFVLWVGVAALVARAHVPNTIIDAVLLPGAILQMIAALYIQESDLRKIASELEFQQNTPLEQPDPEANKQNALENSSL